jgi:hypothetical protein
MKKISNKKGVQKILSKPHTSTLKVQPKGLKHKEKMTPKRSGGRK